MIKDLNLLSLVHFPEYFVATVPWCQLTPTAHKPCDHGEILLEVIPPTLTAAMLNEEPAEAQNKFTKVGYWNYCDTFPYQCE